MKGNQKEEPGDKKPDRKEHLFDRHDKADGSAFRMRDVEHDDHGIIVRKVTPEDKYFKERDIVYVEKHKKEKEKEKSLKELEERKNLHYMKCPKCGADLDEITFKQVKIDKCTECSGIWLDKGELMEILRKETDVIKSLTKQLFQDKEIKKIE